MVAPDDVPTDDAVVLDSMPEDGASASEPGDTISSTDADDDVVAAEEAPTESLADVDAHMLTRRASELEAASQGADLMKVQADHLARTIDEVQKVLTEGLEATLTVVDAAEDGGAGTAGVGGAEGRAESRQRAPVGAEARPRAAAAANLRPARRLALAQP